MTTLVILNLSDQQSELKHDIDFFSFWERTGNVSFCKKITHTQGTY